jgi:hypothetical protein
VCKVLTNLLYCKFIDIAQLPTPFISDLLVAFLSDASATRKQSIEYLIHNIISSGNDLQLMEIFDHTLVNHYVTILIDEENKGEESVPFWISLMKLVDLMEGVMSRKVIEFAIAERGLVLYGGDGQIPLPKVVRSPDDLDPWSVPEGKATRKLYCEIESLFPSLAQNDNNAHLPEGVDGGNVDPPVESDDRFKRWVSEISKIFCDGQKVESLKRQEVNKKTMWMSILERVCGLLDSGKVEVVRGSIKLLLSITVSHHMSKSEADSLIILPRIARCLLINDEVVHLGVCKVLRNLYSCSASG